MRGPVRVLITADAVGGVWEYATTLAQQLAARFGTQVLLAVCGTRPSDAKLAGLRLGAQPQGGTIEITQLDVPLEWEGASPRAYAAAREQILQLALSWHAHILHANEHYLGELGASGLPVLVVSHSDLYSWQLAVHGSQAEPVDPDYVSRVQAGLRGASLVVAPSRFVATSICRHFDYGEVVRVIPNGIVEREDPPMERTIGATMVGRLWDPAKNVACFQQAVAGITDARFLAIGPLQMQGNEMAAPPASAIEYTGTLPNAEVRALLARSRILVSPAYYDPFGLVAAEAAMAGCCLVLSGIDSYRDIWAETAAYFDPSDPQTLRALLQELLHDPARSERLGVAARERAYARYTAERMAQAYHRTYQRLALRYGIAI